MGKYWQGEMVRLRAVEPEDLGWLFEREQDNEAARTLSQIPFPRSKAAIRKWVEKQAVKEPKNDEYFLMITDLRGQQVGSIDSHLCNRRVGCFELGLSIHEPHRRKGYARDALKILLRYFFEELHYQKVTVGVYSFNQPAIALFAALGFVQEGRIRRVALTNSEYHDELRYGLTVEEWRTQRGLVVS